MFVWGLMVTVYLNSGILTTSCLKIAELLFQDFRVENHGILMSDFCVEKHGILNFFGLIPLIV